MSLTWFSPSSLKIRMAAPRAQGNVGCLDTVEAKMTPKYKFFTEIIANNSAVILQ